MSGDAVGAAASGLAGTLVALLFVLALAWGGLKLLRAWQDRSLAATAPGEQALKFIRTLPVGPRERVMLIEAEGERLLIGVAQQSVTLLARWPARTPPPAAPEERG